MRTTKANDQVKLAVNSEVHSGEKSDPIFGSLGPIDNRPPPATPEEALERELAGKTPLDQHLDSSIHPET